jgi:hypothetical protein
MGDTMIQYGLDEEEDWGEEENSCGSRKMPRILVKSMTDRYQ